MNPVSLITRKRDGEALNATEIGELIAEYTRGDVPDYQMAAFLMATFLNGLTADEASALTNAMLHSGQVLDLSDIPGIKVDKHSTGGVGDKVSLILAPLVAACGVPVPMISGRGLGHTGGTLDKLESIPGFNVNLSINEYRRQLERIGVVMIGQTAEIAPADRKIYALRDVTGTVESIPLIAASIMSKKLAEGSDALVSDVKSGRGAFMRKEADARALAETLVRIGLSFGKPTVALLTDMNAPLGRAIGNWPETAEATRILRSEEPAGGRADDVLEVTLALAGEMIFLGGMAGSVDDGILKAKHVLASGHAFEKWVELVESQGGDISVLDNPNSRKDARPIAEIQSATSGYITGIDSLQLGLAAVRLGAGRAKKDDDVDPIAGFVLNKTVGSPVQARESLVTAFASNPSRLDAEAIRRAFTITPEPPAASPSRLLDRFDGVKWGC